MPHVPGMIGQHMVSFRHDLRDQVGWHHYIRPFAHIESGKLTRHDANDSETVAIDLNRFAYRIRSQLQLVSRLGSDHRDGHDRVGGGHAVDMAALQLCKEVCHAPSPSRVVDS